jgi:asparagine N-glycosylation enzyme membrane subunit Stt3
MTPDRFLVYALVAVAVAAGIVIGIALSSTLFGVAIAFFGSVAVVGWDLHRRDARA